MASDTKQNIPTYIGQSPSSNFVGRAKELGELHGLLESNPVVVVLGMHGVGKTELALQYIEKYGEKYEGGKHFLDLRDRKLVDELARDQKDRSNNDIALQTNETEPSELSNWCWEKLEDPSDRVRVLVVLDNVDKAAQIQGMLPRNPRFRLLVMGPSTSTLLSGPDKIHYCVPKSLDILTDKAALELLRKCVGSDRVDVELETAEKLCDDLLGNLPLGIELAGGYLCQDRTITIAKFCNELSQMQDQLDRADERSSPPNITQERGVKSVLELSWQRLDPESQEVCKLLGLFAPRAIPWELVTKILNLNEQEDNKQEENKTISAKVGKVIVEARKRLKKQVNKTSETLSASENIPPKIPKQLANLRLIKWDSKNNAAILDTLVRSFFKEKARVPESLHEKIVDRMFQVCKETVVDDKNPPRFVVMVPHFEKVATEYTLMLSDTQFDLLFSKVGRFYDRQGMYFAALEWYEKWLKTADRRLGHLCAPDTRLKMNNLAHMYDEIVKFQEPQPEYKRALQICEKLLEKYFPEKKDLPSSLYDLGEILFNGSNYKKPNYSAALSLYERTVEIVDKLKDEAKSEGKKLKDEAKSKGDKLIAKAESKPNELMIEKLIPAEREANKIRSDAEYNADILRTKAKQKARRIRSDAEYKAKDWKDDADFKAKKMTKSEAEDLKNKAESEGKEEIRTAELAAKEVENEAELAAKEVKNEAELAAGTLMKEARSEAERDKEKYRLEVEDGKDNARLEAERLKNEAENKAEKLADDAQERVRELTSNAQSKAEKCKEYLPPNNP